MSIFENAMQGRMGAFRLSMEKHWKAHAEKYGYPLYTWDEFAAGIDASIGRDATMLTDYRLMAAREHHLGDGPVTTTALMAWGEEKARILAQAPSNWGECGCMGAHGGQPVCPCRMRHVAVMDGRWVGVYGSGDTLSLEDLGAVQVPAT